MNPETTKTPTSLRETSQDARESQWRNSKNMICRDFHGFSTWVNILLAALRDESLSGGRCGGCVRSCVWFSINNPASLGYALIPIGKKSKKKSETVTIHHSIEGSRVFPSFSRWPNQLLKDTPLPFLACESKHWRRSPWCHWGEKGEVQSFFVVATWGSQWEPVGNPIQRSWRIFFNDFFFKDFSRIWIC